MTSTDLIEIFCILDEFCKYFEPELRRHTLETPGKRHRDRPCRMSDSEIMTILVIFHTRRFRDLKSFYLNYVCKHMRAESPTPSPTTASWSARRRWGCTCCCSLRHALWASALASPS